MAPPAVPCTVPGTEFLSGGGELSSLILQHDWSSTPLGPVAQWPQSLKTTVSLMLNSQHPMWVGWGPQATFLYNEAYISVLSQAKHPWALGRPAAEVWAEIWDVCGPLADRVFQHGQASFQDDVRLFMKRRDYVEEVFYSFSYSPIRDESGGVGGLFCPSAETTGKVLGARRLATLSDLAAEALVKSTVHDACQTAMQIVGRNADDVPFALLFLVDADGALQLASSTHLEGCPPEAFLATTWQVQEVFAQREARTVPVPALPCLPVGLANQPVLRARVLPVSRSKDDEPFGVLVAAASPARPLDQEYESFSGLVASQLASTVQNARAAEEARARAEKLAELDRAKTLFFSNVSHELRTPLTLMLGPLEEMEASSATVQDGTLRHGVTLALRNGRRLHKLVNTLLDFSRIEAGRLRASFVPTDLGAETADLASNFRSAIEKAGMRLVVDCVSTGQQMYVDREMWEKVVLNLVSNAFKYTLQGEIVVRLRMDGTHAVLEVSDTGAGIPEHELPRLFERFHRIEGTRGRTHEGTGIGLALVQELVRLHGGTIAVRSRAGEGSNFEVRIPAGRAHLPQEQVSEVPKAAVPRVGGAYITEALGWLPDEGLESPAPTGTTASGRILLADDNGDMREYIARLLRAEGYEVVLAADGEQALERIRERAPDLVITDVMMPRLDGFGLLKALRSEASHASIPVIMLSARAGEEARVEGLESGADDYLVKPFSARELLGRVTGTLAVARARRAALDIERRLRRDTENILESIGEAFISLDRQWRFTYVNAEAERINGVPREQLLGRDHWEVYPEAVGTEVERRLRSVMATGVPDHFENHYAPWDRWFEISCYPVEEGGITVYYRDISDRKRADEIAREAERRKDEFIATLAHELRNPLAPIRAALQVLHRTPDAAAASRMREVMERQVNHMVRLVDDLMDVARISRGKLELRCQRVQVREVVDAALETSRPLFERARHQLTVTTPDAHLWIDADPTRLAQVISNLLNNAAKYTPDGGEIRLEVQRANEGQLRIAVSDNGAGIAPQLLPHVFDMFAQGHDTIERAQGGLGIGLTLVHQLVRLHGGEVTASSPGLGFGSTFTVTLPLPVQDEAAADAGGARGEQGARDGIRVLVADDNVDAATTLAMLLELMGHRCTAVHDGPSALASFSQVKPDVVLLDIGMPGMDGYEVARRLRAMPGGDSATVVALTGWGAANDRARSAEAGFDLHLTKPVDHAALAAALQGARSVA
ncbi:response regulator [Ramlibacter sp. USB13]|uniref:histidine kinase n=1 Tax=Ramlibacter cellulosilyticus TaxID=2764187 RepID=A0A923MU70_9BURK|nr:ATP-binding protein [Ramlibacter cellulosilyticus]MBC5785071.1 response regulator [Ramlibacter cellulosilyticus]